MAGAMARGIVDQLAGRGASPMQQGGITGGPAQNPQLTSQLLASRLAELGGADPGAVGRKLTQMKQELVAIIQQTAMQIPNTTRHAAAAVTALDKLLEEINNASQTQNAVQATPIGGSVAAIQPGIQQPGMGQFPGAGQPMGQMPPWVM
jgi:hypothetical protein